MVNSKNVIAALGIVAGLGASVLPLSSYAIEDQTSDKTIRATVAEELTLTVTSNVDMETVSGTLNLDRNDSDDTLVHTIEVEGNIYGGYDLTLASKTSETALLRVADDSKDVGDPDRYDSTINIPTGTAVQAGNSYWGYKKGTVQSGDTDPTYDQNYNTIKASGSEDTIFYNENSGNASFDDFIYVQYGVSTSETQAAGIYEGQVTYTATERI